MISRQLFRSARLFNPIFRQFAAQQEAQISSVPGNKPPAFEDSVPGKYAGVLFGVASEQESLNHVLNDMKFFKDLYSKSEEFRNFLGNTAFKRKEQVNPQHHPSLSLTRYETRDTRAHLTLPPMRALRIGQQRDQILNLFLRERMIKP